MKCTNCKGFKKIKGLGMIELNCPSCAGTGLLFDAKPEPLPVVNDLIKNDSLKKQLLDKMSKLS